MKEECNRTLSYSRSTTRLMDPKMNQNVLSSLFSKQFLTNVKNQLCKKTSSSRCIQPPDIKRNSISASDKIQLQLLTQRIKDLVKENQQLKLLVTDMRGEIKRSRQSIPLVIKRLQQSKDNKKNQLFSTVFQVRLQNTKEQQQANEIERLKEKISILQLHKTVKQQRISQLLQKEVRYESQIRLLRMKESCLESEVKSLKQSIKVQLSDFQQKNLAKTNNSDINIVVPYANGQQLPPQISQTQTNMKKIDQLCKNLNIDTCSLIASHCETFQIPQQMHISNLWMKMSHKSEINQIDQLLQEELPFVKISADLEAENGLPAGMFKKGRMDFNNSEIKFDLSQDFNQKPAPIDQSVVKIDVNQKLPAVRRQDSIVIIDL